MKRQLSILLIAILLFVSTGFKCGSQPPLSQRAARAVSAIPSVVRVLFPNAHPSVLNAIDAAGVAFSEFSSNQTASGWQKATSAWYAAKPLLVSLNNSRINQIIAVVEILIGQVTIDAPPEGSKGIAKVRIEFKEADVKRLEELTK